MHIRQLLFLIGTIFSLAQQQALSTESPIVSCYGHIESNPDFSPLKGGPSDISVGK